MNDLPSALTSAGFRHSRRVTGFAVRAESETCAVTTAFRADQPLLGHRFWHPDSFRPLRPIRKIGLLTAHGRC